MCCDVLHSFREGLHSWRADSQREAAKSGPFTAAEDETLLFALSAFAEQHGLSTKNLDWVGKMAEVKAATSHKGNAGFIKGV